MGRARTLTIALVVGLVVVACGQSIAAPAPAKQTRNPAPTVSATVQTTPGQVLFDRSGSGNYRSETFTTRGEWNLVWEAESAPNTTGSFVTITVFDGSGTPIASSIDIDLGPPNSKKSDMAHMHYAGTVSINVQAVGSWHIKAVE